jgi:L-threonylcarbamoyladenylate synthase
MVDFQNDIEHCLAALRAGGIILYPTDTVWGIGCDATNEKAVGKIYALKNRIAEKAMIVLAADEKTILEHVAAPDPRVFDYLAKTARPTTIIYTGAIGLAPNLPGPDGSIAIRICREKFCAHLIKRFRRPIVSTSANISGQPAANTFAAIDLLIKEGVDYIVKYRQDDVTIAEPSAIVKWNKDGTCEVLRK